VDSIATLSGSEFHDEDKSSYNLIYRRVTTVVTEKDSNRYVTISVSPSRQSDIKKSLCHCI